MKERPDLTFIVEREQFFAVGRALQRGVGKTLLGTIQIEARETSLTISSVWGGSQMACEGVGEIRAEVTAKAFCSLITTRYRETAPSGSMKIVFRPNMREISIDRAGVKARFVE